MLQCGGRGYWQSRRWTSAKKKQNKKLGKAGWFSEESEEETPNQLAGRESGGGGGVAKVSLLQSHSEAERDFLSWTSTVRSRTRETEKGRFTAEPPRSWSRRRARQLSVLHSDEDELVDKCSFLFFFPLLPLPDSENGFETRNPDCAVPDHVSVNFLGRGRAGSGVGGPRGVQGWLYSQCIWSPT